jgi:hypothetical protein
MASKGDSVADLEKPVMINVGGHLKVRRSLKRPKALIMRPASRARTGRGPGTGRGRATGAE